ncbi:MAG: HEPN domain-containing protein, partial [Armatimonadetes bacterium]|nr:HEPN domain-containing protein [Armatimonadota bacterium]
AALLDAAREDLARARHSLSGEFVRGAVSSAYYAMFHAAEALLAEKDLDATSHKGVLSEVSLRYVQTHLLPPEQGRQLNLAFDLRLRADYKVQDHMPAEVAREVIAWAEAFIAAAEELLAPRIERTQDEPT